VELVVERESPEKQGDLMQQYSGTHREVSSLIEDYSDGSLEEALRSLEKKGSIYVERYPRVEDGVLRLDIRPSDVVFFGSFPSITRKSLLYQTKVEYGDYTINHLLGCAHGCKYPCYAMNMSKRWGRIADYEDWEITDCHLTAMPHDTGVGVRIEHAPHGKIIDCEIQYINIGVHAFYTPGIVIESCDIHHAEHGIYLQSANDSCIVSTQVRDCTRGIYSSGVDNEHTLEVLDCRVRENQDDGLYVCHVDSVSLDNCTVRGNGLSGLLVSDCDGLEIVDATIVENGQRDGNRGSGATIRDCDGAIAHYSNISSNVKEGLDIDGSSSVSVEFNEFSSNGYGILLSYSGSAVVRSNDLSSNNKLGVGVHYSPHCEISENTIMNNGNSGLKVTSDDCLMVANLLYDNGRFGLQLESVTDCLIYANEFGWNAEDNAYSYSELNNSWYLPMGIGNAWSSYDGQGVYSIPGQGNYYDEYPVPLLWMEDDPGVSVYEGNMSLAGEWAVYGVRPSSYQVLLDGNPVLSGLWFGNNISFTVEDLVPGSHRLMLKIYDEFGHQRNSSITVTIRQSMLGGVFMLGFVVPVSVVAIVFLYMRKREGKKLTSSIA
jgi:parallel beta-helix repeat protein